MRKIRKLVVILIYVLHKVNCIRDRIYDMSYIDAKILVFWHRYGQVNS